MSTNNGLVKQDGSLEAAALDYAARGWPVLSLHSYQDGCCTCEDPNCLSPAKHPLTDHGVKDVSTDPATIRRWWADTNGLANVGIATGGGRMVLDIDPKNGGFESLAEFERRHGPLACSLAPQMSPLPLPPGIVRSLAR